MSKAWEFVKTWGAWLPVAYYDFVKGYPGWVSILWPVSLVVAIRYL